MGTGPEGSVFGENSFYRETWSTSRGGRHVAKRSSDPRVAYPDVKVQKRDRAVGIVAPFPPRGNRYPGKIRFIEPQGGKQARESQAKFRDVSV